MLVCLPSLHYLFFISLSKLHDSIPILLSFHEIIKRNTRNEYGSGELNAPEADWLNKFNVLEIHNY